MSEEQLIESTKQLVAIQSTADNLQGLHQAVDLVATILSERQDITVERFEQNGVPSLLAFYGVTRPENFDVLFSGHLDVVPGKKEQFTPVINDDKFYGRGVYDMKMAALIMTDVFMESGKDSPFTLGLQITSDEEVGGYDGVSHQLEQGLKADFIISGEMTDLGICNETRGICWVELNFKGVGAHGGYAWDGTNAITQAASFAQALLDYYPIPAQKEWRTTANIASISTNNTAYNIVPSDASLKIDFRFTPEDPNFRDIASVHAFIASLDPTAQVVSCSPFEPAVHVGRDNPHLARFIAAYEAVTSQPATLIRRYASGDGRHYALRNMASIEFGLSGANLHGDDEYVDLNTIAPFKAALTTFLEGKKDIAPAANSVYNAVVI